MSRQAASSAFHKSKTLDNKYMLGDEIGKGAYGRVYKGLDLENGDFVAIKQVSLENIAQEDLNIIMQEIDLLKNLNHKNIVKYLGSLKTKTHLHIILEYVENGSLANIIKPNKFGPFPESLVAVYIAQVLEGLVYLHEQGVIHRDIKGANILTTKEGLVKLADFGVATKLTEADVNTHSVVGTPYWMAPEVIEMSGVCAASDIWSVGCTVIELLTCVPPYYDLQPMPALFRIVQDEHPPIPDGLSPDITDFLRQCFKKDARQRPDAKTLLSHPWIQNSRRVLPSSLRHSGTMRNLEEDGSSEAEISNGDDPGAGESPSGEKVKASANELSPDVAEIDKSDSDNVSTINPVEEGHDNSVDNVLSDQVLTLSIHEKPQLSTTSVKLPTGNDVAPSHPGELHEPLHDDEGEVLANGEMKPTDSERKNITAEENGSSTHVEHRSFGFGTKSQDYSPRKTAKASVNVGGNELSRFSDPPGDASLDDLFHPLEKTIGDREAEASTSASSSRMHQGNTIVTDAGKHDLAAKLRNAIAQKQLESDMGIGKSNGGDLISIMMALKEEAIDIDGLGFDDKLPAENLFPVQAVEFGKLAGSLRPEESEDVIVSACQKLITFFHQRPEQKIVFVTQYGLLPLLELLDIPRTRVLCSVLQLLNQIIKDNTDFQENACLVGLIPVVMGFAVSDRPREIRMQAAYFLQQLCQSSSLTLQMFIACRGIPILVGFLEADYAKYREMVHLAIDGMWQVFKLQRSTPRNDFCRIAAKNGILLRLINTLYSLNEATRLASISGGNGFPGDGVVPRPRSGPLDPNNPAFAQNEMPAHGIDQPDFSKAKHGTLDHPLSSGTQEPSRSSISYSPDSRFFPVDSDRIQSSNAEASVASRLSESTSVDKVSNVSSKERENSDRWRIDPSRAEVELRQQRVANRTSTDRAPKLNDGASNWLATTTATQQENVRPLLSLLEKEPPSRHFSGQLEYVRHISGHESILPLLHASNDKKANGLDFLIAEFAEVTGRGRDNANVESTPRTSHKAVNKKVGPATSNEGAASTSGLASQTASGVLSGSGVLNARPGSTTSSGLLSHMVSTFNADVAREYLEKVADLLLEFSGADTTVKSYMCSQSLLSRLFQMFNRIEPPILLKLLKCINLLSTDPHCLENLQRADAIKYLIPNLDLKEGPLISQIHHEVLHALFNLCKINKRRQEQAAENGIIPHLMHFIMSDSPLKQYALPLLCDMAHASRNSREQLRAHGGLDVYLSLLEDDIWSVTALDSIAVCLAHDNDSRKVEQALLKKEAVQKLVKFFQCCPEQHFVHILEPFLKIITKSSRINTTLAVNGLTPLLISRLDHQDAITRLNLLKLIKAVYEHHPRPKQLIVENDLPHKLQSLIEERRDGQRSGGQVLVKQMATSLLKALHINTVL
ncbi:MAP3K epsilon protein kinase 1-like isoform X8 [Diospyros lotus]|uniref:MAP3K epsilon protein kinase 1-like isoform X1 n=1 Tax=Diospyros lotus TaxID=55363 RepID=UPI002251AEC8|nr:MAP3K epsilon protein kinase 1-like isoform X1 [Diospyros lotus]XP_052203825.1 MAP3K epsilon protein kinase 1-like isoform X2 [Diospyros lotus]XP_052203826.1 MAP3K epsilon protein kinase 1-like isoform X3 [Diospyros lotus]XP_052203827.1 MAP3K epsilon protein kinase 1-like isoform X4 [Diospyros lotus]XP_052203828.1 MAP3K epsilon protein kinase 1-like isoform X5 [Diospyros lotus]XP_052203829.1 MAP3K epsilon protein kinase 1-like isoform X6 [Diospyros lotus]XP_052203830.1 MAP3K epsilon protei